MKSFFQGTFFKVQKFLNHNRCLFVENPHSKTPNQRHPHHKRFHVTIWYHIHKPPGWPRLNTRPLAFFNETRILDFISEKIWKYLENCLDFNFIRLFFCFWLRRPELGRMWQKRPLWTFWYKNWSKTLLRYTIYCIATSYNSRKVPMGLSLIVRL